jgi:DNA-binding transcriptional ArsR family regulator
MKRFTDEQIETIAARSRALGDATRGRILSVLSRGEQPVGQIADAAGTQQSTASRHLQVLYHAGLVQRRREASTVIYWVVSPDLLEWCRYLGSRSGRSRSRNDSFHDNELNVSAQRKSR